MTVKKWTWIAAIFGICFFLAACKEMTAPQQTTFAITDQAGRQVDVPADIERIASLDHFCTHIIFALGCQDKLVQQALYGKLGPAMAAVDEKYAAKPPTRSGHEKINFEELAAYNPQIVFAYGSFDKTQVEQLEHAGLKVVILKGETWEESLEAVKLAAKVLRAEEKGQRYVDACENILKIVKERVADIPADKRVKVMLSGPKSIFTAASGEMLQSSMITMAGGRNAAAGLKGFWNDVSPEQVADWNPEVIFLGSSFDQYSVDEVLRNPHLKTVKAITEKKVFVFPSNIGWWDYPAPHSVLGMLWIGKALYPDRFADVDVVKTADAFYGEFLGHSFTSLGGRL